MTEKDAGPPRPRSVSRTGGSDVASPCCNILFLCKQQSEPAGASWRSQGGPAGKKAHLPQQPSSQVRLPKVPHSGNRGSRHSPPRAPLAGKRPSSVPAAERPPRVSEKELDRRLEKLSFIFGAPLDTEEDDMESLPRKVLTRQRIDELSRPRKIMGEDFFLATAAGIAEGQPPLVSRAPRPFRIPDLTERWLEKKAKVKPVGLAAENLKWEHPDPPPPQNKKKAKKPAAEEADDGCSVELRAARQAVKSLSRLSISEVLSLATPPPACETVLLAVLSLLAVSPATWEQAKQKLEEGEPFLERIQSFGKDGLQAAVLQVIEPYLVEIKPEQVPICGDVTQVLYQWLLAVKAEALKPEAPSEVEVAVAPEAQAESEVPVAEAILSPPLEDSGANSETGQDQRQAESALPQSPAQSPATGQLEEGLPEGAAADPPGGHEEALVGIAADSDQLGQSGGVSPSLSQTQGYTQEFDDVLGEEEEEYADDAESAGDEDEASQSLGSTMPKDALDASLPQADLKTSSSSLRSTTYDLEVSIVKARGLRDADWLPGSGRSDPFCTCEITGKPATRIQTQVINDQLDPEWNFVGKVSGFRQSDSLYFAIQDDDAGTADDLLAGLEMLASEVLAKGFEGELQLRAGRDSAELLDSYATLLAT
ncbi:unnamed protein product [Polarella glacialis]|uniref:C2 domain-containing protein n=1 Tax=Polarella glacialis TaxID=89957 RepID=A0A813JWF3_POLGL|nr:unnamed protein product [Polarella glacialis]